MTKLFKFSASEQITSEGILGDRNTFVWLKINICGSEFHKFSFVRKAQDYFRPLPTDSVANAQFS